MISKSLERLAIFIPALYGGGAERTMLKLAGGIAERGYAVDMVLARAEGPYLREVPHSVRIINLNTSRDLASLIPLIRYLRREQPSALLSGLHTNIIALWARRLACVPTRLVVSERTTLSQRVRHYSADLRMKLMPQLVRRFYPWADYVVAVSHGVANDLTDVFKIPRERLRVIYNPIVTPDIQAKVQSPLDHQWFKPGEPPVVLAVGRLTAPKDFPTLIRAFARVCQVNPMRLLILGEGEERSALENLVRSLGIEAQVSMPGFDANPYPYMAHASVFVLSSKWEGLPGVLVEAMFCGVPLVSTDCPSGPKEILADGEYGRLVPVGDIDVLAHAIRDALDKKIQRPPKESWQPFVMEFVVNQYIEILFGKPEKAQ